MEEYKEYLKKHYSNFLKITIIKEYDVDEILPLINEHTIKKTNVYIQDYKVSLPRRIELYHKNNYICNLCYKRANKFLLVYYSLRNEYKLIPIIKTDNKISQLTIDHVIPKKLYKKGNHQINYQVLCGCCNALKADKLIITPRLNQACLDILRYWTRLKLIIIGIVLNYYNENIRNENFQNDGFEN